MPLNCGQYGTLKISVTFRRSNSSRLLRLVHAEVVEEEGEVAAAELCGELVDERKEDLGVYGSRMHQVVDKAALLADGCYHS